MVVFSDATIPGEGEHKILHFIRQQRLSENYDPNRRHCIYGADADLIMLGLSTHEPHFYIIRETVMTQTEKKKLQQREGSFMLGDTKEGEFHEKEAAEIPIIFQFIKLFVVREFLDHEVIQKLSTQANQSNSFATLNCHFLMISKGLWMTSSSCASL